MKPICSVVLASALGVLAFGQAGAATVLMSSDQQNQNHPAVRAVEYFGQLVSQRTQGELSVVVKPDGALGGEQDAVRHVQEGNQAFARVSLGTLSDRVPVVTLLSLPYLFRSSDHMWKVLKGPVGQRLDAELGKAGFVRVMYLESSARDFYCKKPLRSQDDFKGLRIRVLQSKVFETLIENLGAHSVPLPFNKVADAFRAGQIDCAEGGIVNYMEAEHNKLAPVLTQDEHMLLPDVLLMSKKVWDKLPAAQQEVLKHAGSESADYMSKIWRDQEASAMADAKKSGVTILGRGQIFKEGIESQAIKTYNTFVKDSADLDLVMSVVLTR